MFLLVRGVGTFTSPDRWRTVEHLKRALTFAGTVWLGWFRAILSMERVEAALAAVISQRIAVPQLSSLLCLFESLFSKVHRTSRDRKQGVKR